MKKETQLQKLKQYGAMLLFFITFWIFTSIYYGEVFYIAQQNSFFTNQNPVMDFVTSNTPYGYLWWLGRAFLQLYHYPILGGFITTLMFAVIAILLGYILKLRGIWELVKYLPAYAWLTYSVYKGFNLYYQTETGKIFGVPLCILIIVILQTLFMSTFAKRKINSFIGGIYPTKTSWGIVLSVLLIYPIGLIAYNETQREYVLPTVRMQAALQEEDWTEIIKTAKECHVSTRPIAGYYAIALMQTGTITQSLFDIEYNYADMYLLDRNGTKDLGTAYYEADANLHAGLVLSAHRNAMEQMTMDGPTALNLKMLATTSLLLNEEVACRKYLALLDLLPFEQDFISKTETMLNNRELVAQNPRLQKILNLEPVHDSFETLYRRPTFLGYNIMLMEGKSLEALNASLAACLYTKLTPEFLIRTEPLINNTAIGKNIYDALSMEANKNPHVQQLFRIDNLSLSRYQMFIKAAEQYKKDRRKGAEMLKEQYLGYYPYYYFFGNLKSERSPETPSNNNSQVN